MGWWYKRSHYFERTMWGGKHNADLEKIVWSDETKVELLNRIQRCISQAAYTLKHHTCSEVCLYSIMLWAIFDQQGLGILLKWSEDRIVPKDRKTLQVNLSHCWKSEASRWWLYVILIWEDGVRMQIKISPLFLFKTFCIIQQCDIKITRFAFPEGNNSACKA